MFERVQLPHHRTVVVLLENKQLYSSLYGSLCAVRRPFVALDPKKIGSRLVRLSFGYGLGKMVRLRDWENGVNYRFNDFSRHG